MNPGMGTTPLVTFALVLTAMHDQGDGTFTAEHNGQVVSCQPDGSIQFRPAGTAGPWEKFVKLDAKTILFSPEGTVGYAFAFVQGMPNS